MVRVRKGKTRHKFRVDRDEAGVPHVEAADFSAALYGLGYMHATDRGTQILFARAVASGRSAERIVDHPELIETDRFFRRMGLHLSLDQDVATISPTIVEQIQTYCDGINDGLDGLGRTLPMWATGFKPERWNPESVVLVGRLLSFGGLAVGQLQHERLLVELIHAGASEDVLRALFAPRLDEADFDLLRSVRLANRLSDEALEVLTDLPRLAGSNAWAVSPDRSATHAALLAADPHLEVNRLPAIWYEAKLRWGDQYLMGATLPGCPLFSVARTNQLGWGVTYMKGDTIDFFIEDCRRNEADRWQYRRGDTWQDFRVRTESIERKGQTAETIEVLENDLGVLESDPCEPGHYLLTAWSGNRPGSGRAISTWLELMRAPNVATAMDVVRECPQPTLCFMLADRQGHIGLQGCGTFPKRRRATDGILPLPAWDPANHWQGWLSKEHLPRAYDPPEGFLATANENVNPPDGPWLITQIVPDYRKRRIVEQLKEWPRATIHQMQQLQYDLVSVQARDLLNVFLPHLDEGTLKQRLRKWDLQYRPDSNDATVFHRLYIHVMTEILGQEEAIGWRRVVYLCSRTGYSSLVLASTDRLLMNPHAEFWQHHDLGEIIRRAAAHTEARLDIPWSRVNHFQFVDRFFGGNALGRMLGFRSGSVPMPGTAATPFQGHVVRTANRTQTFAPSYHFVSDMSTDEAWTNLPGGPSESRFSRYYRTDLALWLRGQYKRLSPDRRISGIVSNRSAMHGASIVDVP